jgi:hypothetical protein
MSSARTFNDVYTVFELGSLIMDNLALPALLALSYTAKDKYFQVHWYTIFKITRLLLPFGIPTNRLIEHLRITNALVVGSIAFQAVAPAISHIPTDRLDILVIKNELFLFKDWLCYSCDYQLDTSSTSLLYQPSSIIHVVSLTRYINQQKRVINLLAVDTVANAYKTLFYAPNTALMNAITGCGLYTPYRSLLSQNKVAYNHVLNTMVMNSATETTKAQAYNDALLRDFEIRSQGVSFVPVDHHPHIYHQCSCTHHTACPRLIRFTNDSYGAFMHLFSKPEYYAAYYQPDEIPIKVPRLPTVIWRLAAVEGSSAGLAFLLRDLPINLFM